MSDFAVANGIRYSIASSDNMQKREQLHILRYLKTTDTKLTPNAAKVHIDTSKDILRRLYCDSNR